MKREWPAGVSLYDCIKHGIVRANGQRHAPAEDRFWGLVNKDGPEHPTLGKCWLWIGSFMTNGYGRIGIRKRLVGAHRCSWIIHYGEIPDGMYVLHRCDRPACVNPSHLFLGNQVINMGDCATKSRIARGAVLPQTRLTEEQVREIRQQMPFSRSIASVARDYGVCPATIAFVINKQTWKHVE